MAISDWTDTQLRYAIAQRRTQLTKTLPPEQRHAIAELVSVLESELARREEQQEKRDTDE